MTELRFFGAANTVTGSKTLLKAGGRSVLIDCGLFQGYKQLRLKNWSAPPFAVGELDAVLLTHAHIDHSGYLPLLARQGLKAPVYCTKATRALAEILLRDAAHLQEEEAFYANRHGFSRHKPALPLYDGDDAERATRLMQTVDFGQAVSLGEGVQARWIPNGHILGSACIELNVSGQRIVFSGDVGRPNDPIMRPPQPLEHADVLVLESTYGDRRHVADTTEVMLRDVVNRTARRGGSVVIPAFAVGRAQTVLYLLHRLKKRHEIADMPIYLNSPMARDVTEVYREFAGEHKLSEGDYCAMCSMAKIINTPEESEALCQKQWPMIVISASGMAAGGRVLHHLKRMVPDPRNTVLFTGYQAGGTRGATMMAGAPNIKIHGEYFPVRAEIVNLESLSAHADYAELLDWLGSLKTPPKRVFLNHGEPQALDALRLRLFETFGWECEVPDYGEVFSL